MRNLSISSIASIVLCMILIQNCSEGQRNSDSTMGFKPLTKPIVKSIDYPDTHKGDVMDDYHGTKIADPYRWLEDDYSEETKHWVDAENKVTFSYLDNIAFRPALRERLSRLYDYTKFSAPFKKGKYYYYFKQEGLQNQSILYRTSIKEEDGEVFLDPNKFSDDGTVALGTYAFNKDKTLMAYAISRAGSDWQEIYVKNVEDGHILTDSLQWVKFSGISWRGDGFYYSAYPAPDEKSTFTEANKGMRIYYHQIGTPQSQDQLIYEDAQNPDIYFGASVTDDERFLIIRMSKGTSGNALIVKDLNNASSDFVTVKADYDTDLVIVDNVDDELYAMTNAESPNWRLVKFQLNNPTDWINVIPEHEKNVLSGVSLIQDYLFASYREDVKTAIRRYDLKGEHEHVVELPGIGTVSGFGGDRDDRELFYTYTSMTRPNTIYTYDVATDQSTLFKTTDLDYDAELYTTKQVFYPSKDGTLIPMFIVHKKGVELNGQNPTWLYGYGGFNIPLMPAFNPIRLAWLEQGGIVAMANLRGGGEYGRKWHDAGRLLNKQNVFDDFIAAAEYLIHEKYTSSDKLAIHGGSNGGLLVGACMTQRPELFAVAIPAVGVLDMLRYEKFTIGYAWATDYGSVSEKQHFDNIIKYSPLHNLKPGTEYPATLIVTADHDDRVVPAHSFKFAAALQAAHVGDHPVLIRIDVDAGHGAGKPTSKVLDEYADIMSFMMYNMKVEPQY